MQAGAPIVLTGVDGCKGGWITVCYPEGRRANAEARVFADLAGLLAEHSTATIAIDMPIGLPATGGRTAERQVRAQIGRRRSSVFSIPARAAVAAYSEGYPRVCEIARLHSSPPRAPSKQAYHIFTRILEVDAALRQNADLTARLFEVHPELAFRMMNGAPLIHPKKQKGRLCEMGMVLRRKLLLAQGYAADFLDRAPPRGARRDDFYDACAAAWSAARIAAGEASVFPAELEFDAMGLPMRIWA
jgi:predicted RNase H-like nuclease